MMSSGLYWCGVRQHTYNSTGESFKYICICLKAFLAVDCIMGVVGSLHFCATAALIFVTQLQELEKNSKRKKKSSDTLRKGSHDEQFSLKHILITVNNFCEAHYDSDISVFPVLLIIQK